MKDILIFVPTGFEDMELIVTLDIFQREGITYDLVSPEQLNSVRGKYEAYVDTKPMKDFSNLNDYRGLFLPGGPGHTLYSPNKEVMDLIRKYKADGKLLTAICAAPIAFEEAGVLHEHVFTAFPDYPGKLTPTPNPVEVSKNVITGQDFMATAAFAEAVVKKLNEK